jgi:hypothetical protein
MINDAGKHEVKAAAPAVTLSEGEEAARFAAALHPSHKLEGRSGMQGEERAMVASFA